MDDVDRHQGTTIREIELRLEMDGKTVRRHLRVLQEDGEVSVLRFGNRLLLYRWSKEIPSREHQEVHAALSQGDLLRTFQAVVVEGGVRPGRLDSS